MSRNSWIAQLFFVVSTCSIKVSILLFHRRLAAGTHSRAFFYVVWAAISAVVAYAIAFIIVLIAQCRPVNSYWLRFSPTYTGNYNCPSKEAISLPISAYLSVATDAMALILPFWLVWNIKLPKLQKWSLYGIFGLGLMYVYHTPWSDQSSSLLDNRAHAHTHATVSFPALTTCRWAISPTTTQSHTIRTSKRTSISTAFHRPRP